MIYNNYYIHIIMWVTTKSGNSENFQNFKGGGHGIFTIQEGMGYRRGLPNFQDPGGGWPMSDNDFCRGGSDPLGHYGYVLGNIATLFTS